MHGSHIESSRARIPPRKLAVPAGVATSYDEDGGKLFVHNPSKAILEGGVPGMLKVGSFVSATVIP